MIKYHLFKIRAYYGLKTLQGFMMLLIFQKTVGISKVW